MKHNMKNTKLNTPSIYDQPSTQARLAEVRQQLLRLGITYPKVRISAAYIPRRNYVAIDQQWIQTILLG